MLSPSARYAFIVALIALVGRGAAFWAKEQAINLLDEEAILDRPKLNRLVKFVCNETASDNGLWQISRVSSVLSLHDKLQRIDENELKDTPSNNMLLECKRRSMGPIKELRQVLITGNSNVCSEEKVKLIEQFHADYISLNSKDIEKRHLRKDQLPTLLKLFFMHYAMEVSATCKRNLINNIEWDVYKQLDSEDFELFSNGNVDNLVNIFSSSLVTRDKVRDFDDVVLIWDLIDSFQFDVSDWGKEEPPLVELADLDADGIRARIKVQNVAPARHFQEMCTRRFKPLYSKLIVPIIRLSNLGYSYQGEDLSREIGELRTNPDVRRWYAITQVCEAIMPMKYYEDPSMREGAGSIIGWDEVAELEAIQPPRDPKLDEIEVVRYEPSINSFESLDQLDSIDTAKRQKLVNSMDKGASQRSRIMLRAVQRILRDMTNILSAFKMVPMFVTEKKQDLAAKKASGLIDLPAAMEEFDSMNDDELLDMEGGLKARQTIKRVKRVRKNDIENNHRKMSEAISYMHTRGFGEILRGWSEKIEALLPSRRWLVVIGIVVAGLGVMSVICISLASLTAATG